MASAQSRLSSVADSVSKYVVRSFEVVPFQRAPRRVSSPLMSGKRFEPLKSMCSRRCAMPFSP